MTKKVKIIQVCQKFYPTVGGVQNYIRDLCLVLGKKYQVEVVTLRRKTRKIKDQKFNAVNKYLINTKLNRIKLS